MALKQFLMRTSSLQVCSNRNARVWLSGREMSLLPLYPFKISTMEEKDSSTLSKGSERTGGA